MDLHNHFKQKISMTPLHENQDHDHEEFYKPVIQGLGISQTEGSKISKSSTNRIIKKENNKVFAVYTNGHREEPSDSFYDERKDALQHINDIFQDELESKDMIPKTVDVNETPPISPVKSKLNNNEVIEDMNNELLGDKISRNATKRENMKKNTNDMKLEKISFQKGIKKESEDFSPNNYDLKDLSIQNFKDYAQGFIGNDDPKVCNNRNKVEM